MRRLVFLLFLPISLTAGEQWIRLTTPHFELYTSAGEKKGREAILYFEQVRNFFLQVSPSKPPTDFPVRIIAFRGEKEYKPYRLNEFAIAYYTGSHDRDYIVMQDISSEHYPVAIHEYTHLIVHHSGLALPVWLNEGWADFYSTLRPVGNKVRIGDLSPGRLHTLAQQKWLPLETLTAADHSSPYYNERDKAGIFYAQSWALVHMLYFDQRYKANFNRFVAATAGGKSFAEACQTALGITAPQVEKDLKSYFTGRDIYAAIVDIKLARSEEEAIATPLPELDGRLALADLLVMGHKTEQAKDALNTIATQFPARPEVEESLGYLAWQVGDTQGATDHFAKAIAAGTTNPQLCYHYASLAHSGERVDALRRAVNLKPGFVEAWMQLGLALIDQHDYDGSLAAFNRVKSVKSEQASRLFSAQAYALVRTGKMEEARKKAQDAAKWAKTPADTEQAASILKFLDADAASRKAGLTVSASAFSFVETGPGDSEAPPRLTRKDPPAESSTATPVTMVRELLAHAEGKAQHLECDGKQARVSVLTDRGVMKFAIPDPARVTIKHSSEITHEFACGPQQNYRIVVEYLPQPDPVTGAAGIARVLEF